MNSLTVSSECGAQNCSKVNKLEAQHREDTIRIHERIDNFDKQSRESLTRVHERMDKLSTTLKEENSKVERLAEVYIDKVVDKVAKDVRDLDGRVRGISESQIATHTLTAQILDRMKEFSVSSVVDNSWSRALEIGAKLVDSTIKVTVGALITYLFVNGGI